MGVRSQYAMRGTHYGMADGYSQAEGIPVMGSSRPVRLRMQGCDDRKSSIDILSIWCYLVSFGTGCVDNRPTLGFGRKSVSRTESNWVNHLFLRHDNWNTKQSITNKEHLMSLLPVCGTCAHSP